MKNRDIDRYNLSEADKKELRHLRNLRRRKKAKSAQLKRINELQRNGARK